MTTEERLEKLEHELTAAKRRNRRLMIGSAVCLGMVSAWVFLVQPGRLSPAQPESPATGPAPKHPIRLVDLGPAPTTAPAQREVRANAFILEDANGKPRARLDMTGGGAGLRLLDPNGQPRAGLGVCSEGAMLALLDENGRLRASLDVLKDGPSLGLYEENGKPRAWLDVRQDGSGLRLSDTNGQSRAVLGAVKDNPALLLFDENGQPRAVLTVHKDGATLALSDEKGVGRASLGATATTSPDGTETRHPESSLWLFGPDGKRLWSAP